MADLKQLGVKKMSWVHYGTDGCYINIGMSSIDDNPHTFTNAELNSADDFVGTATGSSYESNSRLTVTFSF